MARRKTVDPAEGIEYVRMQFQKVVDEGKLEGNLAAQAAMLGIHLPYLSQRVLFQRTSLPFERTFLFFGKTGANKSAFLYYMYDLFRNSMGRYIHVEVEDKDSPEMRLSLTGYDDDAGWTRPVASLTDCLVQVKYWINWYQQMMAKSQLGRPYPLVIGIDSLTAKMSASAMTTMDSNDGAPGKRFADEARDLNDWYKYIPVHLRGWPISIMAVQHDKPKTENGILTSHTPGGSAPGFYATYRVNLARKGQIKMSSKGWEGNRIRLSLHKSSLGAQVIGVICDFRWRTVSAVNKRGELVTRQESAWDWPKATCDLLVELANGKYGARKDAVRDILGWTKQTGGRFACKALGIAAADALKPAKISRLLEADVDLLAKLEPHLGIHTAVDYAPGVDYTRQVDAARSIARELVPDPASFVRDEDDGDDEDDDDKGKGGGDGS